MSTMITDAAVRVAVSEFELHMRAGTNEETSMRCALEAALPHLAVVKQDLTAASEAGNPVSVGELPPLPEMGYSTLQRGMGDMYEVRVAYTAQQMQDYARAALEAALPNMTAQPSPAGQGDALSVIATKLRAAGANLPAPAVTGTIEGSVVTGLSIALALVEEAIAARQPVGEVSCKTCGGTRLVDDGEINCYPDGTPFECGPVNCVKDCPACAAPPQQPERVDLEQFRALAYFGEQFAFSAEKQPQSRVVYAQARRLRDLINQQESKP